MIQKLAENILAKYGPALQNFAGRNDVLGAVQLEERTVHRTKRREI